MIITILCSDKSHPVMPYLEKWGQSVLSEHEVNIIHSKKDLLGGDFLFLVSCVELIDLDYRRLYRFTLVLHASDLPQGKGWSPHIWEIINGSEVVYLTLLEAEDEVDSGKIWLKKQIRIPKHALWNEINHSIFNTEIELMTKAVDEYLEIKPEIQDLIPDASYYRKRTTEDSLLSPDKTIVSQFDLLRVCDAERYPALLKMHGYTYKITLEKVDE